MRPNTLPTAMLTARGQAEGMTKSLAFADVVTKLHVLQTNSTRPSTIRPVMPQMHRDDAPAAPS